MVIDKCDLNSTKPKHFAYQLFAKREFNAIVKKQRVEQEALSSYSLQKWVRAFLLPKKQGVVDVQGNTVDIYEYEMIIQAIDRIYSCDDVGQLIDLVAIIKSRIERLGYTRIIELYETKRNQVN